jgi:hypothetical protein
MITVSCDPRQLVVGQPARLALRFSNTGPGTCSDIVFTLSLPQEIVRIDGPARVEIREIPAGRTDVREVTVTPRQAGKFEFSSENFSYRDEGVPYRPEKWQARINVEATRQPHPDATDPSRWLEVAHQGGPLALGQGDVLRLVVRNRAGIPLRDVRLTLNSPVTTSGATARFAELHNGVTGRAAFNVRARDSGRLLVKAHATYQYGGSHGEVVTAEQDYTLTVEVAKRPEAAPATEAAVSERTILYLAAVPRDMAPLRLDQEKRDVEERLQLRRNRHHYRMEYWSAVRLRDIGQALVESQPCIVHFAGHGNTDGGIYIEDDAGYSELLDPAGLAKWLRGYSKWIKCVIVNACNSLPLAEAITREDIDYAIGMRAKVSDPASIDFSVGFYQAIAAGQPVPDAFSHARGMLGARQSSSAERETPVLFRRR